MAGAGFEPAKAEPQRLQRCPFDRSGTPPGGCESNDEYLGEGLERSGRALWEGLAARNLELVIARPT